MFNKRKNSNRKGAINYRDLGKIWLYMIDALYIGNRAEAIPRTQWCAVCVVAPSYLTIRHDHMCVIITMILCMSLCHYQYDIVLVIIPLSPRYCACHYPITKMILCISSSYYQHYPVHVIIILPRWYCACHLPITNIILCMSLYHYHHDIVHVIMSASSTGLLCCELILFAPPNLFIYFNFVRYCCPWWCWHF